MSRSDIDEITDFIYNNTPITIGKDTIARYIKLHLQYKTCAILWDDRGIKALARWNINGDTVHILDTIIREDCRNGGVIKELLKCGMCFYPMYPQVKFVKWERERKYPEKKGKVFEVRRLWEARQ